MPIGADPEGHMAPNSYVWQHFSRVERVTGIEPALSAWELFARMGFVLGSLRFSGPERPGVACVCLP